MDPQTFTRSSAAFFTISDGELIVLDDSRECFLSSNIVAVTLWNALEQPATVSSLVDEVLIAFAGVDRATATVDVEEFLHILAERGLVVSTPPA